MSKQPTFDKQPIINRNQGELIIKQKVPKTAAKYDAK